jgi:hypothetical protein
MVLFVLSHAVDIYKLISAIDIYGMKKKGINFN